MIDALLLPFQFPFLQRAFLIVLIVSVPAALLSCHLVLKGWSLMGDAVSHAVLPGIVLAYVAGLPPVVGAFAAGMVCALGTGYLAEHSRVKRDTVTGVVFSGMFGLGLVLYARVPSDLHLDHILYGDMLGVHAADLATAAIIAAAVSIFLVVMRRDLMLHAFDETQARAVGLPVGALHYGLLAALSLTVVATLAAVGLILSIALLIAPGAIAFLVTKRFERMMLVAVAVTVVSGVAGVYASVLIDSTPAPTVVLILTGVFIFVLIRTLRRASRREAMKRPVKT